MSLSGKWDVRHSRKLRLGSGNTRSSTAFSRRQETGGQVGALNFSAFCGFTGSGESHYRNMEGGI
jgi:hypothetical protein